MASPAVAKAKDRCSPPKPTQTKAAPQNCSKPCRKSCSSVVVFYSYPFYSYPVYSYPISNGYVRPNYRVSSFTYTTETRDRDRYELSYEDNYWNLGRDWGQDLRRDVVTFEEFVAFLKEKIVSVPESLHRSFQAGFLYGYGPNAENAFQKALGLAKQPDAGESNEGH